MTLIGPRPERPAFCAEFEKRIHGWHYRTMVTPGLSGLAQVTGGYDLLVRSARFSLTEMPLFRSSRSMRR